VSGALLQAVALSAAFWTALHLALREPGGRRHAARVAGGLALGALLAHLGWAALHAAALAAAPGAWLDPTRGFCVLLVPFGPLLAAPRAPARRAFLDAALGALPLAFALARLGCLAAGCCTGAATALPWAIPGADGLARHPAPVYEAGLCAALHLALRALPRGARAAAALVGLGLARLAVQPLRAPPALGEPALDPRWLAALLIAAGLALARPESARWRPALLFR
jgi:prolipoprotein diacylglyceryltransferase